MECEQCQRDQRMLLEALVAEDQAETDLRCYFLTHLKYAGVSDLDEYSALRTQRQRTAETLDRAYLDSVEHRKRHSSPPNGGTAEQLAA